MNQQIVPSVYPVRVQAIRSKGQNQRLYISFPMALAAAIGLAPGEQVEWELLDRNELHLVRNNSPEPKTKRRSRRSTPS